MSRLTNQIKSLSEMSELIALVTKSEALDDFGAVLAPVEEYTPTIRAKVRYSRTSESEETQQIKFATVIDVIIRYNTDATQEKMILWDEKFYEIIGIKTLDGKRFHVIEAKLIET